MKLEMRVRDGSAEWVETFNASDLSPITWRGARVMATTTAQAEHWARATVENFNASLGPHEGRRSLVSVKLVSE